MTYVWEMKWQHPSGDVTTDPGVNSPEATTNSVVVAMRRAVPKDCTILSIRLRGVLDDKDVFFAHL